MNGYERRTDTNEKWDRPYEGTVPFLGHLTVTYYGIRLIPTFLDQPKL